MLAYPILQPCPQFIRRTARPQCQLRKRREALGRFAIWSRVGSFFFRYTFYFSYFWGLTFANHEMIQFCLYVCFECEKKSEKSIVSVNVVVTQTKLENRKEALSFAYVFVVLIQAVNLAEFCAFCLHLLITLVKSFHSLL